MQKKSHSPFYENNSTKLKINTSIEGILFYPMYWFEDKKWFSIFEISRKIILDFKKMLLVWGDFEVQ